jgi:hypothetical protein
MLHRTIERHVESAFVQDRPGALKRATLACRLGRLVTRVLGLEIRGI